MPSTRTIIVLAVLLAIGAWRHFHSSSSFAADGDPTWDCAVEYSQSTHRPGLVLFTANGGGACRYLHANVLSRSDVEQAIANRYTMITIDLTGPTATNQARAQ